MAAKEKNFWILLVFLLSGLVIGRIIRGTSDKGTMAMVVKLWTRIWIIITSNFRFKYVKVNI